MQNFSIQEIKLLWSLELHEIKRAICKMILASFESYKRENPSCPVLISFSLAVEAQLNSRSDGKDKIGYFRDNDLIRNSNNSLQPGEEERQEEPLSSD